MESFVQRSPSREATASDAAKPPRGRFATMTIEELQTKCLPIFGRATGSDDRRYLIWKIREVRPHVVVHGPPGDQRCSKLSPAAQARAIGSRNCERNGTTSASLSGHSVFGSFFRKAVHCATVDVCSVNSGVKAIGSTSMAVSRLAKVAAMAFASIEPSNANCLASSHTS